VLAPVALDQEATGALVVCGPSGSVVVALGDIDFTNGQLWEVRFLAVNFNTRKHGVASGVQWQVRQIETENLSTVFDAKGLTTHRGVVNKKPLVHGAVDSKSDVQLVSDRRVIKLAVEDQRDVLPGLDKFHWRSIFFRNCVACESPFSISLARDILKGLKWISG